MSWPGILFTFSMVENVLFARLLGLDAGSGKGLEPRRAVSAGLASALLAAGSSAAVWALRVHVLGPLGIGWLQTPAIVLATAGLASLARLVLGRAAPRVADLFGPVLRPSGVTAAALGTVLTVARAEFDLVGCLVAGLAALAFTAFDRVFLAGLVR
jgi:Na+-translocating ferredoxin:NAD+ oxidoreductase RnfA subunit